MWRSPVAVIHQLLLASCLAFVRGVTSGPGQLVETVAAQLCLMMSMELMLAQIQLGCGIG